MVRIYWFASMDNNKEPLFLQQRRCLEHGAEIPLDCSNLIAPTSGQYLHDDWSNKLLCHVNYLPIYLYQCLENNKILNFCVVHNIGQHPSSSSIQQRLSSCHHQRHNQSTSNSKCLSHMWKSYAWNHYHGACYLSMQVLKFVLAKYYKDSEMTAYISERSRNSK